MLVDNRGTIVGVRYLGSTNAVSQAVRQQVAAALN